MESDDRSFLRDAHDIMQLLGDIWTFPVMVTLAEGPLRRSEILREVDSFCADADWLGSTSILHDSILTGEHVHGSASLPVTSKLARQAELGELRTAWLPIRTSPA
jgi:hypothetical protein